MNKLYESMDIPKACEVGSTIFKKMFYDNTSMSCSDKDIFTNSIQRIIWKYSIKEETLNIKPYSTDEVDYQEIAIIEVLLNDDKKYKKIAEIIQKNIPYPLILVFIKDESILINTASKRVNKTDVSKNTVEDYIYTSWINTLDLNKNDEKFLESINIKNLSFINIYKFYYSFLDKLNIFNASNIAGDFDSLKNKNIDEINVLKNSIDVLKQEIDKFKSMVKKEKHFNRKMDINIKIKKKEIKLKGLIEKLKED